MEPAQNVTAMLNAWRGGDTVVLDRLMPILYEELKRIARHYMRGERPDHTLQSGALVNEAYLRLVDVRFVEWRDRVHFFALAAQMMRRVLVDHARSKGYHKRGGGAKKVEIDETMALSPGPSASAMPELVDLDEALTALAEKDPRKARLVELRFFAGLNVEETAEVLQVSEQTVLRDWKLSKAWLMRRLSDGANG